MTVVARAEESGTAPSLRPGRSLAHSAKYLIVATRQFELPADRPATFAVDMAVENIGGEPADFRRGMAAFHVFDPRVSKRVFAVVGTSSRVFAMHEQVAPADGGAGELFYHVVESPYEDFDDDFTRLRAGEITLDRSGSTAAWRVDGQKVYEAHTLIPERALIGFRDLDHASRAGRPLGGWAGLERAVAPIPCTRGRLVSRTRAAPRTKRSSRFVQSSRTPIITLSAKITRSAPPGDANL